MTYRFAYLGNHRPTYSTESHVARSVEDAGHTVVRIQEGETRAVDVPDLVRDGGCDLLLWTQTYGLAETSGTRAERQEMLDRLAALGIPTVGMHLDRWWGLARQDQLDGPNGPEPFFRCTRVVTADGGHPDDWVRVGVEHRWFPPAVAAFECAPAPPNGRYFSPVAFVGSWRGGYHPEWQHRAELVAHLRSAWREKVRFWPAAPNRPVRGAELRTLYASTLVNVGDSCLAPTADGRRMTRYHSDRIPETVGRGGFLLHPWVEGIDDLYEDGKHLRFWPLGDWAELDRLIAYYLEHDDERRAIAARGREHVLERHTYTRRVEELVEMLVAEGVLRPDDEDPT